MSKVKKTLIVSGLFAATAVAGWIIPAMAAPPTADRPATKIGKADKCEVWKLNDSKNDVYIARSDDDRPCTVAVVKHSD